MIRRTTTLVALILALGACTGANEANEPPAPMAPEVGAPTTDPAEAADPDGPDPMRVLAAITVLTSGDVEAAVAEGFLTPEEVDAAERAIADGTVQDWVERAEEALARR